MQEITQKWPPTDEYAKLLSFATRWCRNRQEAVDLLHDSLIIVAENPKKAENIENIAAYRYGVFKKYTLSKASRARSFKGLSEILVDNLVNTFSDTLHQERVNLVRNHLKHAQPMGQRIVARILDGQDTEQIMAAEHLTPAQLSRETWRAKVAIERKVNATGA